MNDNVNNNGGNEGSKVIPINRPKLVVPAGAVQNPPPVASEPESYNYEIALNDTEGTQFFEEGFLVATSAFIGVGFGQGQLSAVVPLNMVKYVRRADDADASSLEDEVA